jgi:D-alanyl-D-alanine carboxypeptidase
MPDGETWVGASGISNGTTPITSDMLFSAGSITKMFTAATIIQLAEEGVITLEDSLYEWLPSYPHIDSTITIRQLLNHTNGIYNITEHPTIWQTIFADPTKVWNLEEIVATYTLAPYFPKGTDWHYSNTGYLLLRMIIRGATGSEISTEYRTRFFEPFDLDGAFLAPEETLPANTARGWFDLNGDGDYDELPFMTSFYSMAGGGVFCSAEDLANWSRALLHNRIVLTQSSLDEMLTFHSPCPGEPLVTGYGLGALNFSPELFNNLEVWGHGGNALGYAAGCLYLPAYGVSIGIMDNTEEGEAMWTINDLISIITEHLEETR